MVNQNGRIPKAAAKKLIEDFHLSQIVIVARTQCGSQICLTDGLTSQDQENAAIAGEVWNRMMDLRNDTRLMKILKQMAKG